MVCYHFTWISLIIDELIKLLLLQDSYATQITNFYELQMLDLYKINSKTTQASKLAPGRGTTIIAMMVPAENIISLFSPITAITRMAKQDVDERIAYR